MIGLLREDNLSRGGIECDTKGDCLEGIECGPVVATKSGNQRVPRERMNVPRGIDSPDAIQRGHVDVICRINGHAKWLAECRARREPFVAGVPGDSCSCHRLDDACCIDRADAVIARVGNPYETVAVDSDAARSTPQLCGRRKSTVSRKANAVSPGYAKDLPACRVTNREIDPTNCTAYRREVEIGLIGGYATNEDTERQRDSLTTRRLPVRRNPRGTGSDDGRNSIRGQIDSSDAEVGLVREVENVGASIATLNAVLSG